MLSFNVTPFISSSYVLGMDKKLRHIIFVGIRLLQPSLVLFQSIAMFSIFLIHSHFPLEMHHKAWPIHHFAAKMVLVFVLQNLPNSWQCQKPDRSYLNYPNNAVLGEHQRQTRLQFFPMKSVKKMREKYARYLLIFDVILM